MFHDLISREFLEFWGQPTSQIFAVSLLILFSYGLGGKRGEDRIRRAERRFLAQDIYLIHKSLTLNIKAETERCGIVSWNRTNDTKAAIQELVLVHDRAFRNSELKKRLEKYLSSIDQLEIAIFGHADDSETSEQAYLDNALAVSKLLSRLSKRGDNLWNSIAKEAREDVRRLETLRELHGISNFSCNEMTESVS